MANLSQQDIVMMVAAAGIILWLTQSSSSSKEDAPASPADDDFTEDDKPHGGADPIAPVGGGGGSAEEGGGGQGGGGEEDGGLLGGGHGGHGFRGGGGEWPGDRNNDWDKRPPGTGGRATAMPHNQATTNDGRDGAWASAEIQLSQRVEHTKERLRAMNIKLRKLESQFGVQIQQVLQGRFADKPWQMLQHFEQLKQTVSLDRHEYESIGRKASIRMDEGEPAAYLMSADKFTGALGRALQRLGMYAKKKDDEADYARQQVKMVKRQAAKDRARLDKASLLRKTTASRAVNRLRNQLTVQQRTHKTASAKSKAKISDLQNQVNDLQDVAMSAAPVVPTMEPTDAFETAGRFDGADIISLGGGHTMSRPANPTETFDNWALSFATSETDMSSFDSALGSVDNRTELARVNETPMGKMPPVHANPPVRKNTGKQQDAGEILNARANLQTQVTEGGGVNLDAITDRLQQLENRVSEVATGTTVTGNDDAAGKLQQRVAQPQPGCPGAPERPARAGDERAVQPDHEQGQAAGKGERGRAPAPARGRQFQREREQPRAAQEAEGQWRRAG